MEKVLVVTCSCLLRTIYITNWICESDVKDLAFMHEINVLTHSLLEILPKNAF